jgi:hypothetical protein
MTVFLPSSPVKKLIGIQFFVFAFKFSRKPSPTLASLPAQFYRVMVGSRLP